MIENIVNDWFAQYICNSPAARETEVYNHLYTAKNALIAELVKALEKPPSGEAQPEGGEQE